MSNDKENNAGEFIFDSNPINTDDKSEVKEHSSDVEYRHHSSGHHRHHHHSSHGRNHSHRHSSKSKKKSQFTSKLKKLLRNNKYVFRSLIVVTLMVVLLVCATVIASELKKDNALQNSASDLNGSILSLTVSDFSEPVSTVPEAVKKFIESESSVSLLDLLKEEGSSGRLDTGIPVTLSYNIRINSKNAFVISASAELWADGSGNEPHRFVEFYGTRNSVNVFNLIPDTAYTFTVTVTLSDGSSGSATGKFTTAPSPRLLNIEGAYNLRDFGGRKTVDGKKIKYGVLFRGSELDGRIEQNYLLTNAGLAEMVGHFGIKKDFDLREANKDMSFSSPLGPSVSRTFYNSQMYTDILTNEGKNTLKNLFTDLAMPENYPGYLHCTYGLDRTGTVCFILGALLGVSEEDLLKDYELSCLSYRNIAKISINTFISEFKRIDGDTLQQKAENLLLSSGITEAQINSIRSIFLED